MKTARQLAVEALSHMEKQDGWSNIILNNTFNSQAGLSSEDKSFASALFYGTLTYRYSIDKLIKPLSKRPLKKLDSAVLNIIRTAIYQILYMDSVPDHSAVDEAVKLTRKMKKSSASGFVNAVVRGFLRTNKEDYPSGLDFKYSAPTDLIDSFMADYGKENAKEILSQSLETPPTFIRVNPNKTTSSELLDDFQNRGLKGKVSELLPNCIKLSSSGSLYATPEYENGLFHIQDISSQLVIEALDPQAGESVLDCCAAPGGKSFIISQKVGEEGQVVACDIYPKRVEEIEIRRKRLGLGNIQTNILDMTEFHEELGTFHRVLCDAPCSGYGTVRRRPEIKYSPISQQETLPSLQLKLLQTAGEYCKKGGILIYSTCTLRKKENENVVSEFLEKNHKFSLIEQKTIFIGENDGDGFYIAKMFHTEE